MQGLNMAVQHAIEQVVGSVLYGHLRHTLIAVAATTRAMISINVAPAGSSPSSSPLATVCTSGELDIAFRERVVLLEGLPQESLGVESSLVSPSNWRAASTALVKIESANSPVAQLDCLVHAAEQVYATIREEHPLQSGQSQRVIAADEFTPIFIWVVLHSGASELCSVRQSHPYLLDLVYTVPCKSRVWCSFNI